MAVKVLDGNEATTGVLVTAQGVGAVVAGAVIGGLVARYGVRLTMVRAVGLLAPAGCLRPRPEPGDDGGRPRCRRLPLHAGAVDLHDGGAAAVAG